ncbi:MAG TPA: hypothetical protein VF074_05535 [Pyrinomonadaceae bacterium]
MMEEMEPGRRRGKQAIPTSSRAGLGYVIAGLGLGGTLAYLLARRSRVMNTNATGREQRFKHTSDNPVDDRGTSQDKAAKMLLNLRDRGFEANDEKVAVALGRTAEEFQAFSSGLETIDDDLIMKARGLAMHRNIQIE